MEITTLDVKNIGYISSVKLCNYLEQHGWVKKRQAEGISVWTYKKGKELFGIFVPLNENFVDYNNRIVEVLYTLEKAENRPFSKILESLHRVC